MKKLKTILLLAGIISCSSSSLKAQDDLADKITRDRDMLKTLRHANGVSETPSGLEYQIQKMGTGPKPQQSSKVVIKYRLLTFDGTAIEDHSDTPWEGRVDNTIAGFQEALKMMPVGSECMVYMPARLCINKKGKVGGGRALIADIKLIAIK
jgi:FKBP-type peptidyl-prolyl cis-trans isomerase FkpA